MYIHCDTQKQDFYAYLARHTPTEYQLVIQSGIIQLVTLTIDTPMCLQCCVHILGNVPRSTHLRRHNYSN